MQAVEVPAKLLNFFLQFLFFFNRAFLYYLTKLLLFSLPALFSVQKAGACGLKDPLSQD